MDFSRRLRELVAGEQQRDVANKLGYTASRISQVLRGEKPSREFVERVIEVYGVDREEWLGYAGLGPNARTSDADQIADAVEARVKRLLDSYQLTPADRVQEELAHYQSGAEILDAGLYRLSKRAGQFLPYNGRIPREELTPEEARAHLADFEAELREEGIL